MILQILHADLFIHKETEFAIILSHPWSKNVARILKDFSVTSLIKILHFFSAKGKEIPNRLPEYLD